MAQCNSAFPDDPDGDDDVDVLYLAGQHPAATAQNIVCSLGRAASNQ